MSMLYTCITCQIAFGTPELQRSHYKTDWHHYNLKRKVVELPPVSAESFQEKVLAIRMADSLKLEEKNFYCITCHKTFANDKSFENHNRSRKHNDLLQKEMKKTPVSKQKAKEEDHEEIEEEEIENESLEVTECLFCPHYEDNMEANLEHMSKSHGFFIPDIEYLTDLEGLLKYLGEKVGVDNMCLYCNEKGKTFYSVEAVQHHMIDKSHCKMYFEDDGALEYAEFYDFSKSYPDKYQSSLDEEVTPSVVRVNDDLELVLPSGVLLGHRYLKNYYKQRLPNDDHRKAAVIGRVMSKYKAIGWKGSYEEVRKDKDRSWAIRMKQQREMQLGIKANKLQKHLRPQVVF